MRQCATHTQGVLICRYVSTTSTLLLSLLPSPSPSLLPPPPSVYALSPCSTPVYSSDVCAEMLDACRGVSDAALEMLRAMKADDPGERAGSSTWAGSLVHTYVRTPQQADKSA